MKKNISFFIIILFSLLYFGCETTASINSDNGNLSKYDRFVEKGKSYIQKTDNYLGKTNLSVEDLKICSKYLEKAASIFSDSISTDAGNAKAYLEMGRVFDKFGAIVEYLYPQTNYWGHASWDLNKYYDINTYKDYLSDIWTQKYKQEPLNSKYLHDFGTYSPYSYHNPFHKEWNYNIAIDYYDKAIKLSSDNEVKYKAYYNEGMIYQEISIHNSDENFTKAKTCFEKAVEISPDNWKGYYKLANMNISKDDTSIYFEKAIIAAENAKDDSIYYLYLKRGDIENKNEQYDKAYEDYSKALYEYDNRKDPSKNEFSTKRNDISEKLDSVKNKNEDLIMAKKLGFSSLQDYNSYLKRTSFTNLLLMLQVGDNSYANGSWIGYNDGDIVNISSNEAMSLMIVDVDYINSEYAYLVTVQYAESGLFRCCKIISKYELNSITMNGKSIIYQPLKLQCIGQDSYLQNYRRKNCYVFALMN